MDSYLCYRKLWLGRRDHDSGRCKAYLLEYAKGPLVADLLQMIFTVFSGSQLYIEANGGGTHVTSLEGLQKLTKASKRSALEDEADWGSGSL